MSRKENANGPHTSCGVMKESVKWRDYVREN